MDIEPSEPDGSNDFRIGCAPAIRYARYLLGVVLTIVVLVDAVKFHGIGKLLGYSTVIGAAAGLVWGATDTSVLVRADGLEVRNPFLIHAVSNSDIAEIQLTQGLWLRVRSRPTRLHVSAGSNFVRGNLKHAEYAKAQIEYRMGPPDPESRSADARALVRVKWTVISWVVLSLASFVAFSLLIHAIAQG